MRQLMRPWQLRILVIAHYLHAYLPMPRFQSDALFDKVSVGRLVRWCSVKVLDVSPSALTSLARIIAGAATPYIIGVRLHAEINHAF